jgi:hypothetical protein
VLAPQGFAPCRGLHEGARIRMGQAILSLD